MKLHHLLSTAALIASCTFFMACDQQVAVDTVVHDDGSISRSIMLEETDSAKVGKNIFGAESASGWSTTLERIEKKYNIRFTKDFPSVEAMNSEMDADQDDRFRIRSEITKRFRWFYTYYRYSDTYGSINRMHGAKQEDFFTDEDFLFIERLPAEGKPITRADSLFLARLNDRIYEDFAARAYYEENFSALLEALKKTGANPQWTDSLLAVKEDYFSEILESEDFDDENFVLILERIGAPVDIAVVRPIHKQLINDFEQRVDFMTNAASMKITHSIQMPWTITETNADSVILNRAFWRPPVIKFMLKDYTMYAEGRSFNLWAGGISLVIILLTVALFLRKKRTLISANP